MRKKSENQLDQEAMRIGYQRMLKEVSAQINDGNHTDAIKALFTERKKHIEKRIADLMNPEQGQ
jgi:hypothetical protein